MAMKEIRHYEIEYTDERAKGKAIESLKHKIANEPFVREIYKNRYADFERQVVTIKQMADGLIETYNKLIYPPAKAREEGEYEK